MTKAFHIAAALFVMTATTASAQSELITIPQETTVLDLAYPYYNIIVEPSTNDPSTTDPFGTPEPSTPEDSSQEPPSETDPTGATTDPSDETDLPGAVREPSDTTSAGTEPDPASVDSTTLFVPPERVTPEEPINPRQPRDPRETPEKPLEEPRECPEQTICPSAQEVIDRTVPQITENQWRVAIIVFGGAAAGGLVWLLTSLLFNNAHSKREQSILHTRTAVKNNNHRMDQLKNSHNKVSESIAGLTETIQSGKKPSSQQIQTLKKAGTELELFGSSKTRSAYNSVLKAVSGKSNEEDFSIATKNLFSALKKDLGLK